MTKILELQLQHQSFQWIFRVNLPEDWLVWSPCCPRDFQESSPAPQFEGINSLAFCLLYGQWSYEPCQAAPPKMDGSQQRVLINVIHWRREWETTPVYLPLEPHELYKRSKKATIRPCIPLLGVCPEKNIIQKDTCTPVFIAALCTTAKTGKQPNCPSTEEWIKKMWYIYIMEYCINIKKNKTMPFAATWKDLERVILSEVSQTEKEKYRMSSHICGI